MLEISKDKHTLMNKGKPFFYLADTCWSAFTNISDDEWDYYLYKRKVQGFNTLQINILPQWDASTTDLQYTPFINNDPYRLNEEYFAHAKHLCEKAKAEGFELALVVLWCNYVPGTWASNIFKDGILPFDCLTQYVQKVHETFTQFHPLYVISGDSDFDSENAISYYVEVASKLKALAPNCLYTTHIKGRYTYIPQALYAYMDLCFYQSGHNAMDLKMPYSLSEEMQTLYPNKPLINSEPCYEEMGYSRNMYGRWTRYDVRRAAYVSILSGACAGITYGAAGIYSWHKVRKGFSSLLGEGFDTPKSWEEAMEFQGAWDYGYLKALMEQLDMQTLLPRQDILVNETEEIRVAMCNEKTLCVYVPSNTNVRLRGDFHTWNIRTIDLETRFIARSECSVKDDITTIHVHPFHEDALIILKKEG